MDITVTREPMEALALKMMQAAEAGDLAAVRDCYADDATLWVNTTGKTVGIDEHLANMKVMRGRVSHLRYLDIRVNPFDGGFVQQHRVLGDLPDGATLDIAACFVVKVRGGKIAHRDEYIDSAAQAPVRG
jgi:ketosteroid isomerase-like protein